MKISIERRQALVPLASRLADEEAGVSDSIRWDAAFHRWMKELLEVAERLIDAPQAA